jgi:hypothetical protein
MNNMTKISGWLGTGVVDLARIGGPATATARPHHGQIVVFSDSPYRRSGVQRLAF